MIVGVVKDIKPEERRVALTPPRAAALRLAGHEVLVERNAGAGAGFDDAAYQRAGARIVDRAEAVWERADLLDRSMARREQLEERFAGTARVLMCDAPTLDDVIAEPDAMIGAVLVAGAVAPWLGRETP